MRRLACLLVSLVAACTFAACGRQEADSPELKEHVENILRFEIWMPIHSLDPRESEGGGSVFVAPFLYSYLFLPDEDGRLEPDLAIDWSYDPAAFTWTVQLREGCLFHDGRPVTAQDVRYSLETFLGNRDPTTSAQVDRIVQLVQDGGSP